ncbi:MAG: DNA replication protein DnaC [Colwellia sp.]|jgi:DNA replication protein DnaC
MTLNFSGRHFPSAIIMQALRYYLAYKLSYREIEEIIAERNIHFDHSTLNRWVIKYSPQLEVNFRTIIASQVPVKEWHQLISNPTIADALLDRLIHNSYKIDLDGDSQRKNNLTLSDH